MEKLVDEVLRLREKVTALGERLVEDKPGRAAEVTEWLDRELSRVDDLIVRSELLETVDSCGSSTADENESKCVFRLRATKETPVKVYRDPETDKHRHGTDYDEHSTAFADTGVSQNLQSYPYNAHANFQPWFFGKSLPKLVLPNFDGDPLKWCDWFGMFEAMIHNTPMSETEKITHLQHACVGRAKAEITGFGYKGTMYNDALEALRERFGKRQFVVRAHLETLQRAQPIVENNLTSVRKLASSVRAVVLTFEDLGYDGDLSAVSNCEMIVQKFSNSMKFRWAKHLTKRGIDQPSLRIVNDWLQEEVKTYEWVGELRPQKSARESTNVSVSDFATKAQIQNSSNRLNCPFEDGNHVVPDCPKFLAMPVDKRIEMVQQHKLCFVCLKKGCWIKRCRCTRCGEGECRANHHKLLHRDPIVSRPSAKTGEVTSEHAGITVENKRPVVLQVLPVKLYGPAGTLETCAMLDLGSTCSLLTERAAKQLALVGEPQQLNLSGIRECSVMTSQRACLEVSAVNHNMPIVHKVEGVWVVDKLNLPIVNVDMSRERHSWSHLNEIDLPSVKGKQIDLLLGSDAIDLIKPIEVVSGEQGSPHAVNTLLGWTVVGPISGMKEMTQNVLHVHERNNDDVLSQLVQQWWKTESFGCTHDMSTIDSEEDKRARDILQTSTVKKGDRYETGLLWKTDDVYLPNNTIMAEKRLYSLERRLDRDPTLKDAYEQVLLGDVEKGYARLLSPVELETPVRNQWFLPHHPVLNPNKPGKVRRVFDASAKFDGISLNDCLLTGPNLMNSLPGILMRFREEAVALVADIEGMYSQVLVPESDQPALRFLWRAGRAKPPSVYQYQRHIFGATSSPTSAIYALQCTARDQEKVYPEAAKIVMSDFFMDDCLHSVGGIASALKVQRDLVAMLATGGFRLVKWLSNAKGVLDEIPPEMLAPSMKEIGQDSSVNRVLGLKWDTLSDSFKFAMNFKDSIKAASAGVLTVRQILSTTSSIYDPLGFLAPAVLAPKLLMQEIWREGLKWDDVVSDDLNKTYLDWLISMDSLKQLSVPRFYKEPDFGNCRVQLHTFVDASEKAFSASSYFRFEYEDGRVSCRFVMGKSRVSPIKPLTIPKLELQAAVLGTRIAKSILAEHRYEIDGIHFWSDSSTVVQWIKNTKARHPTFIGNRIAEIHDVSKPSQWHHIPGKINVADDGSRGLPPECLTNECRWLNGPAFLLLSKDKWPEQCLGLDTFSVSDESACVTQLTGDCVAPDRGPLIDVNRFSSWTRLWRSVCWVKRFVNNCKRPKSERTCGPLTVQERAEAEELLIRLSQKEVFEKEIENLKSGKDVPRSSSLRKLSPFLDSNGVLRSRGRIGKSSLQYSEKYPIILSPKSKVTSLVILRNHQMMHHEGVEYLRNHLRQKFWILKARSAIRKVVRSCKYCRRRNANPTPPMMGDLPEVRVQGQTPVFHASAVDYFGPVMVTQNRRTQKRYGCLFVCLATKAVHVEISHSLDTESFLMSLRRFIARRGPPRILYSDNGTNFVGADRELKQLIQNWNQTQISDALLQDNIEWHFNPPSAPHFNGLVERLVRSTKRAIKAILQSITITDEVLLTVAAEAEFLLNNRPLTPVSDDVNDFDALTPNHFLLGRTCNNLPPGVYYDKDVTCRQRWRRSQALTNQLWKRWSKEYLRMLMERSKWCTQSNNLSVSDLVLIADSDRPRGSWLLGRVLKLYHGRDGVARVADIKTKSGQLKRPVTKLILMSE